MNKYTHTYIHINPPKLTPHTYLSNRKFILICGSIRNEILCRSLEEKVQWLTEIQVLLLLLVVVVVMVVWWYGGVLCCFGGS